MRIVLTGGASGLGRAITERIAKMEEHSLLFTYCASEASALEIEKKFPNTKSFKCDYRNQGDIERFVKTLADMDFSVLINNAIAGLSKNHFHKLDPRVFSDGFSDNILPVIKVTQQAIGSFRKNKFGKIITILSSYLTCPPIGLSEYTAAKAYLLSLSRSWAIENAPFNITSNCVSPSFMRTSLTSDTDDRMIEQMVGRHPLKKLLTPEEVAETVAFLANSTQQINGVNLIMDYDAYAV